MVESFYKSKFNLEYLNSKYEQEYRKRQDNEFIKSTKYLVFFLLLLSCFDFVYEGLHYDEFISKGKVLIKTTYLISLFTLVISTFLFVIVLIFKHPLVHRLSCYSAFVLITFPYINMIFVIGTDSQISLILNNFLKVLDIIIKIVIIFIFKMF